MPQVPFSIAPLPHRLAMANCLIALGSNLGDRAAQLRRAVDELTRLPMTSLLARSGWHVTPPVGGPTGQGVFLNAAALVSTLLEPAAVLGELRRIETLLGRVRSQQWEARSIDLDLVLYDELTLETAELQIPHPRMHYRRFVLAPAAEAAPWMLHPGSGWTIQRLLNHLDAGRDAIAVASADPQTTDWLVAELATRLELPVVGDDESPTSRPYVTRWGFDPKTHARRPKLILAVPGAAGVDAPDARRILQLPSLGPVAWISDGREDAVGDAIAAVQSVWPMLTAIDT